MKTVREALAGQSVTTIFVHLSFTRNIFLGIYFVCPICVNAGVSIHDATKAISRGYVPRKSTDIHAEMNEAMKKKKLFPKEVHMGGLICSHCHESGF